MRIAMIQQWLNPNMAETVALLEARGVKVDGICPEQQMTDIGQLRVEHDLYLLKSGTSLAMSVAGCLHAAGAATLNPYPVVALLRNKITATRLLQLAGVPTPDTYLAATREQLADRLAAGPLLIKPYMGSYGRGVRVIERPEDIEDMPPGEPIMVQHYHKPDGDGRDYKIFNIGNQLFGVRRIWPIKTYADKAGQSFELSPELRDITLRCGQAFGIDLFGLDIVISEGQPYVVDVNKFGSYMGVPDAPKLLANYLYNAVQRAAHGAPAAQP
ncbi:MAG: hypothetical protein U0350_31715 [Caldilineaceae bacterium]